MNKRVGPRFAPNRLAIAVAGCFCLGPVFANPLGAELVSGSATLATQGNTLTITNTPGAIVNWQGFSIAAGETTRFVQASAASSVLNRVVTNTPSQLYGQLLSNGRVFLINPAGILVGAGALVDTAGFVASTLNLSNADFLAGKLNFTATPGAGSVENYGTISTPSGGSVYLVGAQVENHGIINSPNGEVLLAAGKTAQLIDTGTPGVRVEITADSEQALNVGQILAESGRIGMVGAIVRNSGRISASSVVSEGGRVFLKATADAYVEQGGSIDATGTTGGHVEVLGNRVALLDQASIDVSGTHGGGTILVGGDYQGSNADIQNASVTYVGAGASLKADAIQDGNGGKIIVWADQTTRYYGDISARGGAQSGDGGFVEVSGKRYLDFQGTVSTAAAQGLTGTLLLDPEGVSISTAASSGGMSASTPFAGPMSGLSILNVSTLQTALANNNVVVDGSGYGSNANGSVTVDAAVSWASNKELTLKSGSAGGVAINEAITAAAGSLKIDAGSGGVTQTAGGVIETATLGIVSKGDVVLNSAANKAATVAADLTGATGKNFSYKSSGAFAVGTASGITGIATSGTVLLNAGGSITQSQAISASGLEVVAASDVTLNNANQVSTIAADLSDGSFSFTNSSDLTIGTVGNSSGVIARGNNTNGDVTISTTANKTITVAAGKTVSGAAVELASNGGAITINGTVTAAGQVSIHAGTGALISGSAGLVSGPIIRLQVGETQSGAIGSSSASFRTGSPAVGDADIYIGSNSSSNNPSAVYLSHTGNATLKQVITSGAAPIDITASDTLTIERNISTTGDLALSAGNLLQQSNDDMSLSAANITLSANRMALRANIEAASGGTVWLKPYSAGWKIDLGSTANDAANTLELSATELNYANVSGTGKLRIGSTSAGALNVSAPIAPANASTLVLESGGAITQAATGTITVGNLLVKSSGAVQLASAVNRVGTLAADLGSVGSNGLAFKNGQALVIGSVGGTDGLKAPGAIGLETTVGGITQTESASIEADSLDVKSVGSVALDNLNNQVGSLTATLTGAASSLLYKNKAGFSVGNVATNNGNVELRAYGNTALRVSGNVNAGTGGVIIAQSGEGGPNGHLVTDSGTTITGGSVELRISENADSKIKVDGNVVGGSGGVTLYAKGGINGVGAVSSAGALNLQTNNTEINQGQLTVTGTATINAGTGNIVLTNAGNTFGAALNVTGGAIGIYAASALSFTNLSYGSNKAIDLQTSVGNLTLPGSIDTGTANLTLKSAGSLTTTGTLAGANVSLAGASGLSLGHAINATNNLTLASSAGAISQTAGTLSVGGALTASAATGISLSQSGNSAASASLTNSTSGTVAYSATGSTTLSGSNAGAGSFTASTTGDLRLGLISNTGGAVSLTSSGGALIDANGDANNIAAASAVLSAKTGIGSGNAIETQVSTLSADNTGTGNIDLSNTGALTTTKVSTVTGDVAVQTHSPLTIGGSGVSATGSITLTAGNSGAGGTGDILTINGPVTSSGGGAISLSAGNGITGSNVPSGSNVSLHPNGNPAVVAAATAAAATRAVAALTATTASTAAMAAAAAQNQATVALDTAQSAQSSQQTFSLTLTSPATAAASTGAGNLQATQTFPGGVVGGEAPNTFGSDSKGSTNDEPETGAPKKAFGQCMA